MPHLSFPCLPAVLQVGPTNLAGWTMDERNQLNGIIKGLSPPPPAPPPLGCIPWQQWQAQQAARRSLLGNGTSAGAGAHAAASAAAAIPAAFDWRAKGWVTPIKFQGKCRSCWAFASAAAIETLWASQTKVLVELSPQAFIDCCTANGYFGCNGGWRWVGQSGGGAGGSGGVGCASGGGGSGGVGGGGGGGGGGSEPMWVGQVN